jgi:hypothetical protein
MKKTVFTILISVFYLTHLKAQSGKLQIGVQTGFAIPIGQFASGYGYYPDNGYATIGSNYKIYAEYRAKGVLCFGLNYINFSNSLDEGNLRYGFNNRFSTNNVKIDEKSKTEGLLASIILKGIETPLFIKGFMGMGYSTSAKFSAKNTIESTSVLAFTSDLGIISGIGIGFYVPISNKWFIELEGDYILSSARPNYIIVKDNNSSYSVNLGDISYKQNAININVGVGIFLFND